MSHFITQPENITEETLPQLTEILKSKDQHLTKELVLSIIKDSIAILKTEKPIQPFQHATRLTIVGDTHGQFFDLLNILKNNGMPNENNPYIFNGDFVDRGAYGCEVLLMILMLKTIWPEYVLLNRGNHECQWVSSSYGFSEECIVEKYDEEVYNEFCELFKHLPLASLVENKTSGKRIFVVHGGLYEHFEKYDLEWINKNIRKPEDTSAALLLEEVENVKNGENNEIETDDLEVREIKNQIVQDLLWSDPRMKIGMMFNGNRGQGQIWGPDQSRKFCRQHNLEYIVRSHETVGEGWETTHAGAVHTVFSAANYCGCAGNLGAILLINGEDLKPVPIKFAGVEGEDQMNDEIKYLMKLQKLTDEEFDDEVSVLKVEDVEEEVPVLKVETLS